MFEINIVLPKNKYNFINKVEIKKWLMRTNDYLNLLLNSPKKQNLRWLRIKKKIAIKNQYLNILLVGKKTISQINNQYRKKTNPTNVLSFSNLIEQHQILQADILICYPLIISYAKEYSIDPKFRLVHLIIHGYLHILGLDHQQINERKFMENLEIELLANLGYGNPYIL